MRMEKQKLSGELKNTPTSASLACSSVSLGLNKPETVSVRDKVLTDNSLEENQLLHTGGLKANMYVCVINKDGKPLMPCKPAKARRLLKQQKAEVLRRTPFTIQLLWDCEHNTQKTVLGIDSGYGHVGFSVNTEKRELVSGELLLRKNVSRLIEQKKNYRRTRRNKLWHRPARFNNRVSTKKKGWLAPSMQHKLNTHVKLINDLKNWLPITKTIIEVASFDTQKMQNPEISSVEYQQGTLQGYEVREYLLEKFGRKCSYCGKGKIPLEIEHITPKSKGGSSRVNNLTLSCRKCNVNKGTKTAEEYGFPKLQKLAKKSLKATVFMNLVRSRLADQMGAEITYGYITKKGRIDNNLVKSHVNDAFVIAKGSTQNRCTPFAVTQTRRNNRSMQTNRKGHKPSIRRTRYKLQPNDLVKLGKLHCSVKGVFNYGNWVRLVDNLGNIINSNIKKVEVICYGKGMQFSIA